MDLPTKLLSLLTLVVVPACGGTAGAPPSVASPEAEPEGRPASVKPIPRGEAVAAAKVFDEHGNAAPCGPAQPTCPPLPVTSDFMDRCRLAGFRVLQCGCEARCTGDIATLSRHYDADGQVKECARSRPDCTPPQASSAFQDACSEHGFRLDVCGCEWLCSGDFKH